MVIPVQSGSLALSFSFYFRNFPTMKIFSAEQFKAWDSYTILEEPIRPIELMERAAHRCFSWIIAQFPEQEHFTVLCGKGNNGGDGLAIARLLANNGKRVVVEVLEFGYAGTPEFQFNLSRLHQFPQVTIRYIQQADQVPVLASQTIIIDALYGSGLNRGLEGLSAALVEVANASCLTCISIDLPSGLFCDRSSVGFPVIKATYTLCLQSYKLAMMMPENDIYLGQVQLLNIGLHSGFYTNTKSAFYLQLLDDIKPLVPKRKKTAHKGNFGHALLLCGGTGKMGAAVLAAKGALRTGLGLLTCQVPVEGNLVLQTTVPESMCSLDRHPDRLTELPKDLSRFSAIGIGPGVGTHADTAVMLEELLSNYPHPIVLDADALNIIAGQKDMMDKISANSVITPHPKEFARLFGESATDFDRLQKAIEKATRYRIFIVLKGQHSIIACPDGSVYFNGSGNPGMATGGMGDVLTGIVTGLLAQPISPLQAVRLGVYLHGLAGNLAAHAVSEPALLPTDLLDYLGAAWLSLE